MRLVKTDRPNTNIDARASSLVSWQCSIRFVSSLVSWRITWSKTKWKDDIAILTKIVLHCNNKKVIHMVGHVYIEIHRKYLENIYFTVGHTTVGQLIWEKKHVLWIFFLKRKWMTTISTQREVDNHVKNKKYESFVSISSLTGKCSAQKLILVYKHVNIIWS